MQKFEFQDLNLDENFGVEIFGSTKRLIVTFGTLVLNFTHRSKVFQNRVFIKIVFNNPKIGVTQSTWARWFSWSFFKVLAYSLS